MQIKKTIGGTQCYYLIADFIETLKKPEELKISYYYKNMDNIIENYLIKTGIQLNVKSQPKLIACLFDIDIHTIYNKVFTEYCGKVNAKNKANLLVNIQIELSEEDKLIEGVKSDVSSVTNKLISMGDGTYIREIIVVDYFDQTIKSSISFVNNNLRGNPLYNIQKNYFDTWMNSEIIDLFSLKNEKLALKDLTSEKLSTMLANFIADTDRNNLLSSDVLDNSDKQFKHCDLSSMTMSKITNELIKFKERENLYIDAYKTAGIRCVASELSIYVKYLFDKLVENNYSLNNKFVHFVSYEGNCISANTRSFFFNSLIEQKCQINVCEKDEKIILNLYCGKTKLLSIDPTATCNPEKVIIQCFEKSMLEQIKICQNDEIFNRYFKKHQEKINNDIYTALDKDKVILSRSESIEITSENIQNNIVPLKINYSTYSKEVCFTSEESLKEEIQMFLNEVEKKIINEYYNMSSEKNIVLPKKNVRL